jgi:hypothetical protein
MKHLLKQHKVSYKPLQCCCHVPSLCTYERHSPSWDYSKWQTFGGGGWMPLMSSLARIMTSAFWWWITVNLASQQLHILTESAFCMFLFCDHIGYSVPVTPILWTCNDTSITIISISLYFNRVTMCLDVPYFTILLFLMPDDFTTSD